MKTPPPLACFLNLSDYLKALAPETKELFQKEIESLHARGLPPVVSGRALAVLFGYRPQFLGGILHRPDLYYRVFTIKKGAKRRVIHAPKVALKVIQTWAAFNLSRNITLSDSVVGFVPKKSTFDGAVVHCQSDWIFTTDIQNFFQTTSFPMVVEALGKLGYSHSGARILASLSCLNGFLAQGSPLSPVLSNLAFSEYDGQIKRLCENRGFRYTRYADDIVVSGREKYPSELGAEIINIIESGGWSVATAKTKVFVSPKRMKVYGLVVNGKVPRLTKGYRKRLRAIRHLLDLGKIDADRIDAANGHLSYANSIDRYAEAMADSSDLFL